MRLGLLVNPVAGLGGPLGLKGSDALAAEGRRGEEPRAALRAEQMLAALLPWQDQLEIYTVAGAMGEVAARAAGFQPQPVYMPSDPSYAKDTMAGAQALIAAGIDLLLFAGGDGTARDVCQAVGMVVPVLGIPAGVKMHSGVFAVSPSGAAEIVKLLLTGELVTVGEAEVRDIDEAGLNEGRVRTRHFGELKVPVEGRFLQQVKCSGREVDELAVQEIAAEVTENLEPGVTYLVGPGSTTAAVMEALGLPNTLLGFDAFRDQQLVGQDLDADALAALITAGPVKAILTATPVQGHLIGRGNQQLTPASLRALGRDNLIVVATHSKLLELGGRPLLLDSGDAGLDQEFSGWIEVITGYQHRSLYRLATHA